MKKIIALFLFAVAFTAVTAQSVVFKERFLPDRAYHTTEKINTKTTMDFAGGDSVTMQEMRDKGMKLPTILTSDNNIDLSIISGDLGDGKLFPMFFTYNEVTYKSSINGVENANPGVDEMNGAQVFAKCDEDGKIQIDSVLGKRITDQGKETLGATLSSLTNSLHFPDAPMKIGDTFSQEIPFNFPMAGMKAVFNIKVVYKLITIKGNIAQFDLTQGLDMAAVVNDKFEMDGSGTGNGKMTYDIKECFATNIISQLKIACTMKFDGLIFKGEFITTTTDNSAVNSAK